MMLQIQYTRTINTENIHPKEHCNGLLRSITWFSMKFVRDLAHFRPAKYIQFTWHPLRSTVHWAVAPTEIQYLHLYLTALVRVMSEKPRCVLLFSNFCVSNRVYSSMVFTTNCVRHEIIQQKLSYRMKRTHRFYAARTTPQVTHSP